MIDEEIMNTAVGKQDAKRLKELINKIDGGARPEAAGSKPENSKTQQESATTGQNKNSSFKQVKPVDQQTKFSSSSKVVVSKYSKNGTSSSKQNLLAEGNSIFGGRRTPTMDKSQNESDEQEDLDE